MMTMERVQQMQLSRYEPTRKSAPRNWKMRLQRWIWRTLHRRLY